MGEPKADAKGRGGNWGTAAGRVVDILAAIRLFFGEIRENVRERADGFLQRAQFLFVVYCWISVGLVFLIIGIFDLLIDQAGVSRGVVYSLGGILISLVSVIFLQAAKVKKHHK